MNLNGRLNAWPTYFEQQLNENSAQAGRGGWSKRRPLNMITRTLYLTLREEGIKEFSLFHQLKSLFSMVPLFSGTDQRKLLFKFKKYQELRFVWPLFIGGFGTSAEFFYKLGVFFFTNFN